MQARGCLYRDFRRQILCRLSLLIKLIVRTDSGAPELSLNYAAIYLGYWGGASHNALSISSSLISFFPVCVYALQLYLIISYYETLALSYSLVIADVCLSLSLVLL